MERVIFHIEVNNAFLSWEAHYRITELGETLDLRTVASAIGGDEKTRHGIIVAKSPIAKSYGVKTAETLNEARRKCPNLLIVPPRHDVYKKYSHKLLSLLQEYSRIIEKFSIDEAFVAKYWQKWHRISKNQTASTVCSLTRFRKKCGLFP